MGHLGECPKGWLHEVEKILNSRYGELRSVCMKELTLKLWIYQKIVNFSIYPLTDLHSLEFMGWFSQTVSRPKNLVSLPMLLSEFSKDIKCILSFHGADPVINDDFLGSNLCFKFIFKQQECTIPMLAQLIPISHYNSFLEKAFHVSIMQYLFCILKIVLQQRWPTCGILATSNCSHGFMWLLHLHKGFNFLYICTLLNR